MAEKIKAEKHIIGAAFDFIDDPFKKSGHRSRQTGEFACMPVSIRNEIFTEPPGDPDILP